MASKYVFFFGLLLLAIIPCILNSIILGVSLCASHFLYLVNEESSMEYKVQTLF